VSEEEFNAPKKALISSATKEEERKRNFQFTLYEEFHNLRFNSILLAFRRQSRSRGEEKTVGARRKAMNFPAAGV
jgi:hypothetical protein